MQEKQLELKSYNQRTGNVVSRLENK